MIEVAISTNGHPLRRIVVYNRGPVGGADGQSYDKGDDYAGGGLRKYEWQIIVDQAKTDIGEVLHARRDGIEELVARVLTDVAERVMLTRDMARITRSNEQADTWHVEPDVRPKRRKQ